MARITVSDPPRQTKQLITATGAQTKVVGDFRRVTVGMTAPGGAGGSGRKGAAGTIRCGGGGGSHGAQLVAQYDYADFPSAFTVTINAAGVGGASQTVNDTNGNNGTAGGIVTLIGGNLSMRVPGGSGGGGGTNATGTAGGVTVSMFTSTAGAGASVTGGQGNEAGTASGASGPSGGGIPVGDTYSNGGNGRAAVQFGQQSLQPLGGTADGASGTAALAINAPDTLPPGGISGGSGASSVLGNAGNGGAPAGYGAGGSGGGAAVNGVGNSGAGSNGGPGVVIIIYE